jgi:hypothetical protein
LPRQIHITTLTQLNYRILVRLIPALEQLNSQTLIRSHSANMPATTRSMERRMRGELVQRRHQRDAALTSHQVPLRSTPEASKSTPSLLPTSSLRNLTTQTPFKKQPSSPADYLKASNLTTGCSLSASARTKDREFHMHSETWPPRGSQKSTPPTEA